MPLNKDPKKNGNLEKELMLSKELINLFLKANLPVDLKRTGLLVKEQLWSREMTT